jgi:hypothetical protein
MTTNFLAWCLSTPWALDPAHMQAAASLLARRYGYGRKAEPVAFDDEGGPTLAETMAARAPAAAPGRSR